MPILILVAIAIPSFKLLMLQYTYPKPDVTIKATATRGSGSTSIRARRRRTRPSPSPRTCCRMKKWPRRSSQGIPTPRLLAVDNEIVVPVNKVVHVLVTSNDVIHNWTIPSVRLENRRRAGPPDRDVVQVAEYEGVFYGQCSELCGMNHAFMPIAVRVVKQETCSISGPTAMKAGDRKKAQGDHRSRGAGSCRDQVGRRTLPSSSAAAESLGQRREAALRASVTGPRIQPETKRSKTMGSTTAHARSSRPRTDRHSPLAFLHEP